LIERVRRLGCRIHLIPDGDVGAAIATCLPDSGIDVLVGIGAAPEGVLAASAMRCVGGTFRGQLKFRNEEEKQRARGMGVTDPDRMYTERELAQGDDVVFAATGVSDGDLLKGVRFRAGGAVTHSLVMRSRSGTIRMLKTEHVFDRKPNY
jgi:fructose-1,6-bisphosphatase II